MQHGLGRRQPPWQNQINLFSRFDGATDKADTDTADTVLKLVPRRDSVAQPTLLDHISIISHVDAS